MKKQIEPTNVSEVTNKIPFS